MLDGQDDDKSIEKQQEVVDMERSVVCSQQEIFDQQHLNNASDERKPFRYSSLKLDQEPLDQDSDDSDDSDPDELYCSLSCICYQLLIIILTLQLGPMLYLFAHEGGHCMYANAIGMRSQLYLGCDEALRSGEGLFDDQHHVVVCAPFYYSLVFQHGFCMYDFDGSKTKITKSQDAILCIAGGFVGALAMYLLLMLVTSAGIAYQNCYGRSSDSPISRSAHTTHRINCTCPSSKCCVCWHSSALTRPFRLYSIIREGVQQKVLSTNTAAVLCFLSSVIYIMNVNRIFYSLVPAAPNAIRYPRNVSDVGGDGYDLWKLTGSFEGPNATKILPFAQALQLMQYTVLILLLVQFVKEVRRIGNCCGDGGQGSREEPKEEDDDGPRMVLDMDIDVQSEGLFREPRHGNDEACL